MAWASWPTTTLVVTDVGANDVLWVATGDDAGMKRTMPLQVIADPAGGFGFILDAGM